jgi:hypothetical protein
MPETYVGKKWRNVWLFRNSVFKDWITDSEQKLKECFEFDWKCCMVQKIIKDETDKASVYSYMLKIYPFFK